MKKIFLLFLMFVFVINNCFAQYKRKLKEPDFFIPYNEKMHKQEKLFLLKNKGITISKTDNKKEKVEDFFNKKPDYKKIYDNYLNEINIFITTKNFRENIDLNEDLKSMENGDVFEVEDDNSSDIDTQEQYNFYMLAKSLLEN